MIIPEITTCFTRDASCFIHNYPFPYKCLTKTEKSFSPIGPPSTQLTWDHSSNPTPDAPFVWMIYLHERRKMATLKGKWLGKQFPSNEWSIWEVESNSGLR